MPAPLVDTHCHLNFQRFDEDRAAVLQRAYEAGVERIIIPAIDLSSCIEALQLAEAQPSLYGAVGIHPNSSRSFDSSSIDRLREFAAQPKVLAIGEIGLDYHWDKSPRAAQVRALEKQLELAAELALPVIIHNREASADIIEILADWAATARARLGRRLGVLHSFSASAEIAEHAIELGFYLGFTGPLTFKKASQLREVARQTPVERLLVETDAPFLAPVPRRGKRNEPAWLCHINARLAALHGMTVKQMARQTTRNAETLFALS
ncbi:MAG: TatD family hydrolase [Chloroflexi bacterium]|nr:TatD family hydrolase [Chloroflexota bacterium]MCY3583998.1 TatD family hydrolase [Chloroflexota bacterium]MCY3716666.1 TatD family hydrolase [Chloroflexota bacterium]MDE2649386.1 TatD family hydrolase [Chloroflexota bacterium]MXV92445.1 TatD family deoxyribonuclease [Chloroflexota bacterium]